MEAFWLYRRRNVMNRNRAYLHDMSTLPGRSGLQAIFRPRQKKQARLVCFPPEARGAGDLGGEQPRDSERCLAIGEWMWIGLWHSSLSDDEAAGEATSGWSSWAGYSTLLPFIWVSEDSSRRLSSKVRAGTTTGDDEDEETRGTLFTWGSDDARCLRSWTGNARRRISSM
jgi:hypothetical protein